MNYFEARVKYQKIDETGKEKTVNEVYLVDAVSNGEAEARSHIELEKYISGEFTVKGTKQINYSEVVSSNEFDDWYKCKVSLGVEKKSNTTILMQGDNVGQVYLAMHEHLSDTVTDFEIPKVELSNIIDVFKYESE